MTRVGRNDPCPCGSGKKYKRCCFAKDEAARATAALAARARADNTDYFARTPAPPDPASPAEHAADLMDEAWEASERRGARLAHEALAIWPDCVDAHIYLADIAHIPEEALGHFQQAVAAGERTLDPDEVRDYLGDLFLSETGATYLTARIGLVEVLRELGRTDEAVAHATEILALDTTDTAMMRLLLLPEFLRRGDLAAAHQLVQRFPTSLWPGWLYHAALVKYQLYGDALFARRSLTLGLMMNPLVAEYLTGAKQLPRRQPKADDLGIAAQAQRYALDFSDLWEQTPGAIDWLRATAADPVSLDEPTDPASAGPRVHICLGVHATCGECGQNLVAGGATLAVLVEPDQTVAVEAPGFGCPQCDILVVSEFGFQQALERELAAIAPALIGNDQIMLGVFPPEMADQLTSGQLDAAAVTEHVVKFRELYDFPDDDLGWLPDLSDPNGEPADLMEALAAITGEIEEEHRSHRRRR